YRAGLEVINRLKPITYDWKANGLRDLGFGAEEVAKVDPLLVTYNRQGEVEGVKYDRLSTVFVNAIKEQQTQIQAQQQQLQRQQQELVVLKRWVCRTHPKTAFCQPAKLAKR